MDFETQGSDCEDAMLWDYWSLEEVRRRSQFKASRTGENPIDFSRPVLWHETNVCPFFSGSESGSGKKAARRVCRGSEQVIASKPGLWGGCQARSGAEWAPFEEVSFLFVATKILTLSFCEFPAFCRVRIIVVREERNLWRPIRAFWISSDFVTIFIPA